MRAGAGGASGDARVRRSSGSRILLRVLLVAGSAAVALLVAEIGFRIHAARTSTWTLADAIEKAGPPVAGGSNPWVRALRVDPNPRIAYGLRRSFDGVVEMGPRAVHVSTNSLGFRGPEWQREKPPGTVRIVGVGDSVMMGFGIEQTESYLSLLEKGLARSHPGVRFEVMNLAVGGYNTVQEVATLRDAGLAFSPDIVLVGIVGNDANGIIYPNVPDDALALDRSFLLEALAQRKDGSEGLTFGGFDELGLAVDELAALSEEHGFAVLAFSFITRPQTETLLESFSTRGIPVRDLGVGLTAFLESAGIPNYPQSNLVLDPKDLHPSATGNILIARSLEAALEEGGFVEPCVRRAEAELSASR